MQILKFYCYCFKEKISFVQRGIINEKIGLLIGIALLLACQNILDFDLIWKLAFPAILVAIWLSIIFKDVIGGIGSIE